jgi:putative transposase
MERINKEFKRESRMIWVFPNQESVLRLTVSILIDRNEDGTTENKYIIIE